MIRDRCQSLARSRWFILALCLCLGGFVLLASWVGGQLASGLIGLAVLGCFGLLMSLASGSETVRGLRGDGRDERFALIDLRATAVTGQVLIVVVIIGWLVEIASGHSGSPYDWLGAVGGIVYAAAVAFFRWRG
jgi:uncharacterized YccA/Bax inhibitor family protein